MAKPTLTMKYAGGLIKHLGLQMYSGAVPSIAELIKNAYDANATEVNISILFAKPWNASSKIEVKDNGHGIPKEYLPRLFDPFFTSKKSGMGLGLTTAYSIIQSHKAGLRVESNENEGTNFLISFMNSQESGVGSL